MTALVVVEAVAIGLLGLLVAGLLRSHAEILRQLHALGAGREGEGAPAPATAVDVPMGPTPGSRAHDVAGATPWGDAVAVGVTGVPHDTLLAFLSSGCLTCSGFWEALGRPGDELGLPPHTRVVAVTKGPGEESESALREVVPRQLTVVMSTQAWLDYEVPGSPYFVHVDGARGRVAGEGTAASWDQVASLVARATEDRMVVRTRNGERQAEVRREARIDQELLAAGIRPGDPQLYPTDPPVAEDDP